MLGVTSMAMIATAPGQTVVISQFNNAIRTDLGLSASSLSAAYMVGTVAAAFPVVLIGKASDRFGPRLMTGIIAVVFAIVCACVGLANGIVGLTIAFFLLRFLGQGSLGLVSGHALALWFERRLGSMNGLKLMIAQLGFAIIPAITLWLIDAYGWRAAYQLLGVGVILLVLPLAIFVARDRPDQLGQNIDGDPVSEPTERVMDDASDEFDPTGHAHVDPAFTLAQALRSPAFWVVTLALALNGLIGTAMIFHAQPMLEAQQLDPNASAAILRTWSFTMLAAIFPAGWLADRVSVRVLVPLSLCFLAVSAGIMVYAQGMAAMHGSMLIFGLAHAIIAGVGPPTIARYFGRAHHGAIRATTALMSVAGTGLGPVTLGLSLDRYGSFTPGLYVFIGLCVPLIIAGMFIKRPAPPVL